MLTAPRINFLRFIVILSALLFAGKLFFIQILHGEDYKEQASNQYVSPIANIFDRGSVFFTKLDGSLLSGATLKSGYTVAINPSILKDAPMVYKSLSTIIKDLDSDTFFLRAGKIEDPYEEVARRISEKDARAIEDLHISGVDVYKERWRFYPGGTQAAHLLGFVGYEGNETKGRYGLERYYNEVLERTGNTSVNLFAEVFANIKNSLLYDSKDLASGNLILTLEPGVQTFIEGVLEDISESTNARSGGMLIINPQTGAVYALAARPTFDPNNFSVEKDYSVFSNSLVESVFEMGSIVKPLTLAIGFDEGVIEPTDTYYDPGSVVLNGRTIGNYDGKARGRVPLQEILNQSLNTGAIHVARKVGNDRFAERLLSFGLREKTGIDLPNEVAGLAQNIESGRDVEIATASFGQGFAVTPIAIVRALSVLANGGLLITPYVVTRIEHTEGLRGEVEKEQQEPIRVLSEEASEKITRMLVQVVDTALAGGTAKIAHYSVAAKTGTAQIARPEGGYYDDRFLHTFFGYFPAYDPQFLIFFFLAEPKGFRFASETLTRPFVETVNFLIHYYNIPPDR